MTLGRLPNKSDVETLSKYTVGMFEEAFDTWSAALKAAKIVLSLAPEKTEQPEIFERGSFIARAITGSIFNQRCRS